MSPEYAKALTVEHPATSSPGLAFVLATIDEYGEEGWLEFWSDLRPAVSASSRTGTPPTTATSPGTEERARWSSRTPRRLLPRSSSPPSRSTRRRPASSRLGAIGRSSMPGSSPGPTTPKQPVDLIDFMLSVEFQETVPLTWFVFPVNGDGRPAPEFVEHTTIPADTGATRSRDHRRKPRPVDRRVGRRDGGLMTPIRWGHLLVAAVPALFIGYFFVYPLVRILALGLSELNIGSDGVEARLFQIGWFTLWQAVLSTVLTLLAAAPMTWAVSHYEFRGRKLATALVTVPFVLPTVVVGAAFVALGWRDSVGAILAAHVFFNVAVVVRTVGALWSRIDPDLHDAGRVLGAREWKVFRTVTLPLLRPAIAAAAAIVFLFTFTSFGVVLILGGFRFATLEVEIYRQAVTLFDLPSGRRAGHRAVGRGDWGPLRILPLSGASHVDLGPPRRGGPAQTGGRGRVSWSQAVSLAP